MLVKVRVKAGASKESVRKMAEDVLEVSVREKSEGNRANERVRELVARQFGVPAKKIRMIKGHHHPSKTFSIVG